MKFLNVLHVENEPLLQRSIKKLLWESNVTVAQTYEEALESLGIDGEYDLIICDYDLAEGNGNGEDILKWIKEKRPHLEKVFLFCSGNDKVSQLGTRFVLKPYSRNEMIGAIHSIIKG